MDCAFGKNVKRIRKEKGLTQKELADMIGFKSIASVSKYEQSDEMPRRKVALKFANALGVDVQTLLESTIPFEPIEINPTIYSSYSSSMDDGKENNVEDNSKDNTDSKDNDALLISILMRDLSNEHKKEIYELIVKYHTMDTVSRGDK